MYIVDVSPGMNLCLAFEPKTGPIGPGIPIWLPPFLLLFEPGTHLAKNSDVTDGGQIAQVDDNAGFSLHQEFHVPHIAGHKRSSAVADLAGIV